MPPKLTDPELAAAVPEGAYLHCVLKLSWFTLTVPSALMVMCAVS